MPSFRRTAHVTVATIALGLGAGSLGFVLTAPTTARQGSGAIDTTAGIEAASWADNVTITFAPEEETFRYQSDGIPAGGVADAYLVPDDPSTMPFNDDPADSFWTLAGDEIQETPIDTTITTAPVYAEEPTLTDLGQIGVAIDGARIFNDYEDRERQVVALNDNVIHDHAAFVDECTGHPLGDGTTYHYHGIPTCISDTLDTEGEHSHAIRDVADAASVPEVSHLVFPDAVDGYNIQILTRNFRFTPAAINGAVEGNAGHAHVYVNGAKVMRVYSDWVHLPGQILQPGVNLVTITLNANDHSTWGMDGVSIASTVRVVVPDAQDS